MSEAERRAAIREWMDRIRLEDGNMPRNWMYWRRLYLEGLEAEERSVVFTASSGDTYTRCGKTREVTK